MAFIGITGWAPAESVTQVASQKMKCGMRTRRRSTRPMLTTMKRSYRPLFGIRNWQAATRNPKTPNPYRAEPAYFPLRYSATAAISSGVILATIECITSLSLVRSR